MERGGGASTVVRIDLARFKGRIFDVSTPEGCCCHDILPAADGGAARNFALKHREVVLEGYVPPEAVVGEHKTEMLLVGKRRCSFDEFFAARSKLPKLYNKLANLMQAVLSLDQGVLFTFSFVLVFVYPFFF